MRNHKTIMTTLAALGFIIASAIGATSFAHCGSCGVGDHSHKASAEAADTSAKDIVDTAIAAGQFNTLVTAVKEAGLVSVLKGPGPFTVFAPTDEAFASLPDGALKALIADKKKLTAVLTYHVVPGAVRAADVVKLDQAKTVQGQSVQIGTKGGVTIDGARVLKTDIETSNGIIHVIDRVIMPRDLIETVLANDNLSTLATAVQAAGLIETLQSSGPFTIFAPTNEAFAQLPDGALDALIADKDKLVAVLTSHVLADQFLAADVAGLTGATTVQGYRVKINADDAVMVDNARVIETDILTTNGVIHLIDQVILPQM
jgi:transforming growth factor-beta-induced protein